MSQQPLRESVSLWLDALRSGRYIQVTAALNTDGRYCCLGVACELYQQHVGGLVITQHLNRTLYNGEGELLPPIVQAWLGLRNPSGQHYSGQLTEDNDDGKSFLEIADIIEARPVGLFDDTGG